MTSLPSRAVLLLLAVLAAVPAAGRSACELQLEAADTSLRSGQFESALDQARECLRGPSSRREKARAYALLALTYLAADETAQARVAVASLLRADPDFEPDLFDAPRFTRLVEEARQTAGAVQVTSVSKTPESLREAPATVVVVTAEEIERRGYLDLEQIFHDLPGFHISRANGVAYSNLYQRGYLSNTTDRTLFLVDGIEQNDLTSNVAFLSRQYPLSNVDRVEVIYGPASTMYGANAYLGVINVILKEPESLLAKGARFGSSLQVGGGAFETRSLDGMLAGRTRDGSVSWSLVGRTFQSAEPDLSDFPDWDYRTSFFAAKSDDDYRGALRLRGAAMAAFLAKHEGAASGLYHVVERDGAQVIEPTDEGIRRARELDAAVMAQEVGGRRLEFSDLTDDRWVSATVKMSNLKLDLQHWEQNEGITPWYHELTQPGAGNGALWSPRQTALSAKYSRPLRESLSLHFFSRYKLHDLGPDSSTFTLKSYAGGTLKLEDLVSGTASGWQRTNLYRSSTQLQNELSLAWEASERLSLVGGIELRHGSIQGDYVRADDTGLAAESGTDPRLPGGNQFSVREGGLYLQANYEVRENLKVVAGGRFDANQVRERGGYGSVFNPRLAVVYSPGDLVLKAIYSEAFKDASNFNRYATVPGVRDLANPTLGPEKAKNLEVSAGWQRGPLSVEAAAWQARYSDVVGTRDVAFQGGTTTQFQNIGSARVRGLEANGTLRWRRLDLFANYTYVQPYSTTAEEVRFGDVASHQANLGAGAPIGRSLEAHLRLNYVGDRPTGKGTTTPSNPFSEISGYTTLHSALTYKHARSGARLQLVVNNLLDDRYYDPGVRQAGREYAARIPQAGRAAYLRLLLKR